MPLILPGNVASATAAAFSVDNSCRFNAADTSYMSKASASTASQTIGTISVWIKIGDTVKADQEQIIGCVDTGYCLLVIKPTTNTLKFYSAVHDLETLRALRDPAAWYHIFVNWDTTQGTAANRAKIYINGVQNTTWTAEDYPAEDATLPFFVDNEELVIGRNDSNTSNYFDGYMAEMVVLEGTAAAVTDFGEFNDDSPTIWQPIDHDQSSNKGANGFHLDFKDSANLGNDAYGGTDYTETNLAAADQATDSPTNNFCVMNPLNNYYAVSVFSEGNTQVVFNATDYGTNTGTFGVSTGKWYWEIKAPAGSTIFGIADSPQTADTQYLGYNLYEWGKYSSTNYFNNATSTSWGTTWAAGSIVAVALDLDNNKLYFADDNVWWESGDPTSGATGTGAISITAAASTSSGVYFPAGGQYGEAKTFYFNFGNPSYDNASDAADANGYGKFEFAPPSGYLSLCTKNLGSDGG